MIVNSLHVCMHDCDSKYYRIIH